MSDDTRNFLWHFAKFGLYFTGFLYIYDLYQYLKDDDRNQRCQIYKNEISIENHEKRALELEKMLE